MPQLCLWRGEKDIREGLQKALDSAGTKPTVSIEGELRKALEDMAKCLYKALRRYLGDDAEELDVYFWPGYDSILGTRGAENRLMLKSKVGADIGIGLRGRDAAPYEQCFSQTAFDSLLVRNETDSLASGTAFYPGGTHPWISAKELKLSGDLPLNAVAIEILPKLEESKNFAADPEHGVLSIFLDRSTFRHWGNAIAGILNDASVLETSRDKESAPQVNWPYARRANDRLLDVREFEQACDFRLRLYTVWLASNLSGSPSAYESSGLADYPQWVDVFAQDLKDAGLKALAERLMLLQHSPVECHCLPFWYTFNLERTVSIAQKQLDGSGGANKPTFGNELGSLMVLSSKPLPHEFFSLTRPWVERIYNWMRVVESSLLTLRLGAESQSHEFVHQIAGLVKLILYDEHIDRLSPVGRSAAWHLEAVARVWSNDRLEGQRPLTESSDSYLQTFVSYSPLEFITVLVEQAMRHALRKARMAPDRPGDHLGEEVQQYARAHSRAPEDALRQLQMVIEGSPPDWVKTEGFVVAFHHCFWQAAYHGLRASFSGLPAPYLWIECSEHKVVIFNRGTAAAFSGTPQDWLFFRRLEERLAGYLTIRPELREAGGLGVVTITRGALA